MTGTYGEELRVNLLLTPRAAEALRRTRSLYEVPYEILLEAVTGIADIELCQRTLARSGEDVQQEIEIVETAQEWSENATHAFFADVPERRVMETKQSFRSRIEE